MLREAAGWQLWSSHASLLAENSCAAGGIPTYYEGCTDCTLLLPSRSRRPRKPHLSPRDVQRHLRHRRRWRASRLASKHSPFTTHTILRHAQLLLEGASQQLDHFGSIDNLRPAPVSVRRLRIHCDASTTLPATRARSTIREQHWTHVGVRGSTTGHAIGLGRAPLRGAVYTTTKGLRQC